MKKIFVYNVAIFNTDLLVCVGVTINQIKKWIFKNAIKELKNKFRDKKMIEELDGLIKDNKGFVYLIGDKKKRFYFLYLTDFTNTWSDMDVLNHEIVHIKQAIFENRHTENETEFEAYFVESTFRELRKKLNSL